MTRKGRRIALISTAVAVLGIAVGLVLYAMRGSIVFFYGPTEAAQKAYPGERLRIGGLVEQGSVKHEDGSQVAFSITDGKTDVAVTYVGLLPDLFREGQGVVAEGVLVRPGVFRADNVLAKHDERYMPKDVADELKKEGRWNEGQTASSAPTPAATRTQ